MKSSLSVFISLIFFGLLIACSGGQTEKTNPTSDTIQNEPDSATIIKQQQEKAKTRDSLPSNCTAEQAIEYMKTSGYWNNYSTGIIPSIVRQYLPYAHRLINNKYNHFIIVDKGSMQVILYDKYGHLKLNYKMACGRNYGHKRSKADCRTPEGIFQCGGWFDSTDWLYTNDWGVTSPARGQFGPRFIRICPQIGIHGTAARYSIGRRCSHGCIRIQNENVLELVKYVEKGMPIIVNPGANDVAANKANGVSMPRLDIPNIPSPKNATIDPSKFNKKNDEKNKSSQKSQNKSTETKTEQKAQEGEIQETPVTTPSTESTTPKVETPTPAPAPSQTPSAPEPKPKQEPATKAEPKPTTPATTL